MTKTANLAYSGNTEKKPPGDGHPSGAYFVLTRITYFLGYLEYMLGLFFCQVSLVLFNFLLYISCIVLIYFLEVSFMAKKGWQFFLGEDVVAELDEYAKEWGMTRSAALTMIIKTVVGGKKVINAPEDSSDSVSSDLLSHA